MSQTAFPVFAEDIPAFELIERRCDLMPGTVAIAYGPPWDRHELIVEGNDADDLLERYRAAHDERSRLAVLKSTINGASLETYH